MSLGLTVRGRGDSKTYTFVIENEKGRESFSVALEVREPFLLTMMIGGAIVIFLSGFKPAPESIVENGCPDNDRADLTTAKTVPYCTNPIIKGKIATIAEDPFYKDGKKGAVKFMEGTNGIRSKPDLPLSGNVGLEYSTSSFEDRRAKK
ncbi:kin of IRRE-like protein 2, partial [Caerostris extrusa]